MLMSTFTPTSTSTTTLKWNKFEHFYHSPFPRGRKEGPTKHLKSIFLVENSLFLTEMLGKQLNSTFETTLELSSTMLFVKQLFSFLSFWVVAVFLRNSISFFFILSPEFALPKIRQNCLKFYVFSLSHLSCLNTHILMSFIICWNPKQKVLQSFTSELPKK